MNAKDKLFIVDLTSVSFFDSEKLKNIASSEEYKKVPFLYLISSYVKNSAISNAYSRLKFIEKRSNYDWDIYCFEK